MIAASGRIRWWGVWWSDKCPPRLNRGCVAPQRSLLFHWRHSEATPPRRKSIRFHWAWWGCVIERRDCLVWTEPVNDWYWSQTFEAYSTIPSCSGVRSTTSIWSSAGCREINSPPKIHACDPITERVCEERWSRALEASRVQVLECCSSWTVARGLLGPVDMNVWPPVLALWHTDNKVLDSVALGALTKRRREVQ